MYNDVREFVALCETCYKVKANTHAKKAKVQIPEISKTLFHTIHLDHLKLAVPNASHQYNYVLIIIDELSLQVELIPEFIHDQQFEPQDQDNLSCRGVL